MQTIQKHATLYKRIQKNTKACKSIQMDAYMIVIVIVLVIVMFLKKQIY